MCLVRTSFRVNPFEHDWQMKAFEEFEGRCVVRWRSRCSPLENEREHDGHVWVAFAGEVLALGIVGGVIAICWFMSEEEDEKDVGDGSREIEVPRDPDEVGDWGRCK